MPLNPKKSLLALAKEMMSAGHPKDQSWAAAYAAKRRKKKATKN